MSGNTNQGGKVRKVTKANSRTDFVYDATGKRVSKKVTTISTGAVTETRYIYDASGNVLATHTIKNTEDSVSIDYGLYGSSRLGMYSGSKYKTADVTAGPTPGTVCRYVPGRYRYELSNHLGNVHAVVTGLKTGRDTNADGKADYYQANIMSLTDYYPFGMEMPARTYVNGTDYRYGFNGKENDKGEWNTGSVYDYGFRIYDARIAKFLSVDPLSPKYPFYTPYQFASNSPIIAIDGDGLETSVNTNPTENGYYHNGHGDVVQYNGSQSLPDKNVNWTYLGTTTRQFHTLPQKYQVLKPDEYDQKSFYKAKLTTISANLEIYKAKAEADNIRAEADQKRAGMPNMATNQIGLTSGTSKYDFGSELLKTTRDIALSAGSLGAESRAVSEEGRAARILKINNAATIKNYTFASNLLGHIGNGLGGIGILSDGLKMYNDPKERTLENVVWLTFDTAIFAATTLNPAAGAARATQLTFKTAQFALGTSYSIGKIWWQSSNEK